MVTLAVRLARLGRTADKARWLIRYWVCDKYYEQCRAVACAAATVVAALAAWSLVTGWGVTRAPDLAMPGEPRTIQAIVWWVQLIILVVAAIISYAMMPKPEPAKPIEGKTPTVQDGKAVRRIYGRNWTDDSAILAWKNLDPEPIRKKGGKK